MFEDNTYIIDIFEVLEAHNKEVAENLFSQLNIQSFPYMDENKQTQFIDGIKNLAGYELENNNDSFDKQGLESLRNKVSKK